MSPKDADNVGIREGSAEERVRSNGRMMISRGNPDKIFKTFPDVREDKPTLSTATLEPVLRIFHTHTSLSHK
jgi:hypothetical protein